MEDAATAEISRSQVWQWVRNGTVLTDGTVVTAELVRRIMDEEMESLGADFQQAREIFERVALDEEYVDFLTLPAYEAISVTDLQDRIDRCSQQRTPGWLGPIRVPRPPARAHRLRPGGPVRARDRRGLRRGGAVASSTRPRRPGADASLVERVRARLARQPVDDLRIDFEDGYGFRLDEEEDAAVLGDRTPAGVPASGIRFKSLEAATRRRGLRTLELFLAEGGRGVLTLPRSPPSSRCRRWSRRATTSRTGTGSPAWVRDPDRDPQAVLAADGTAVVARMVHAAAGRVTGLHYGTYDYSAALGIAPAQQSLDHPVADHAKAVLQVAAAGTGVFVSDGSTNVLPAGDHRTAAWQLHGRLVRRSLERGLYQGWDLHPLSFRPGSSRRSRSSATVSLSPSTGCCATWTGRSPATSTSRRPRPPSPTTCCGRWSAEPSTRTRSRSPWTGSRPHPSEPDMNLDEINRGPATGAPSTAGLCRRAAMG